MAGWLQEGSGQPLLPFCTEPRRGVRSLNPPLARLAALDGGAQRDADVAAEEARMRDLLQHRTGEGEP